MRDPFSCPTDVPRLTDVQEIPRQEMSEEDWVAWLTMSNALVTERRELARNSLLQQAVIDAARRIVTTGSSSIRELSTALDALDQHMNDTTAP